MPEVLLAELETGRASEDEDLEPAGRAKKKQALQIKDALALVDAAGDDQEVVLAAYGLSQDSRYHHWSAASLVSEVRRQRERQAVIDAAGKKLAAEGVPVIEPIQRFGQDYWQYRLEGAKAVAAARKAGALAAGVDSWGSVTYYSTAGKPRKADNRSAAEQQRITDERERRKAMTARSEAAAVLAATAPKLPPSAADIVDAWLWAPGSDCAQLAHKWLLAAEVGPDPALPSYQWWEKVRRSGWHTRVHAAHALGLARREVQARATHRTWTHDDASWLARLVEHAGYTPSAWEQARLDAINPPESEPASSAGPQRISLSFDDVDACCWLLHYDGQDEPAAYAEHLGDPDGVGVAQAWAAEGLADRYGIEVTAWAEGQLVPGRPAYLAVHAGDPTAAAVESGPVGEWRLLHDPVDGVTRTMPPRPPPAPPGLPPRSSAASGGSSPSTAETNTLRTGAPLASRRLPMRSPNSAPARAASSGSDVACAADFGCSGVMGFAPAAGYLPALSTLAGLVAELSRPRTSPPAARPAPAPPASRPAPAPLTAP
ncbi:hypothetical protein AB0H52_31855, partial [Micromonospora sp. NPDC050695]